MHVSKVAMGLVLALSAGCAPAGEAPPSWPSPGPDGKADSHTSNVSVLGPDAAGFLTLFLRGPVGDGLRRALHAESSSLTFEDGYVVNVYDEALRCGKHATNGDQYCAVAIPEPHFIEHEETLEDGRHLSFGGPAADFLLATAADRAFDPGGNGLLACTEGRCAVRFSVLGVTERSREARGVLELLELLKRSPPVERPSGVWASAMEQATGDAVTAEAILSYLAAGTIDSLRELRAVPSVAPAAITKLIAKSRLRTYRQLNDFADQCWVSSRKSTPVGDDWIVIEAILADGVLDRDELENQLVPTLTALPEFASPTARGLLDVLGDSRIEMHPSVALSLQSYLEDWFGYRLPNDRRITSSEIEAAIAANVTEQDDRFACLFATVGHASSSRLTVAVIDSGTDLGHQALSYQLWRNSDEIPENGLDDDANGLVDDVHGWDFLDEDPNPDGISLEGAYHGLHVAAIAGQGTWRITLMNLKVSDGDFSDAAETTPRRVAALHYAASHGARVVNLSSGIVDGYAEAVLDAMRAHPEVLFVFAAGNSGQRMSPGTFTNHALAAADLSNVLLVAASDSNTGERAAYSVFHPSLVDVATVGNVTSARAGSSNRFGRSSGTSQASPGIANIAAKVLLLAPELEPVNVRDLLFAATPFDPSWDGLVAANGVVDEGRALTLAALISLARQGMSFDGAGDLLGLRGAERAELLDLAAAL